MYYTIKNEDEDYLQCVAEADDLPLFIIWIIVDISLVMRLGRYSSVLTTIRGVTSMETE